MSEYGNGVKSGQELEPAGEDELAGINYGYYEPDLTERQILEQKIEALRHKIEVKEYAKKTVPEVDMEIHQQDIDELKAELAKLERQLAELPLE